MSGRILSLPIDELIGTKNAVQNRPSTFVDKGKSRMKNAFDIAAANTKQKRDMNTGRIRKQDYKLLM